KRTTDALERLAKDLCVSDCETISINVEQNLLAPRTISVLGAFQEIIKKVATKADDPAEPISEVVKAAVLDTGYERMLKDEKTDESEARMLEQEALVNPAVQTGQC